MIINTHPSDRRRMIHELSDLLSTPAEYLRSPTYGYRIGHLIVNRDGTISTEAPHMLEVIRPFLLERHYLTEETSVETETPAPAPISRREMHITAAVEDLNTFQLTQLMLILYSRQYIINRMLQTNALFIDYDYARQLECDSPDSVPAFSGRFKNAAEQGQISGVSISDNHITLDIPLDAQDPDNLPIYNDLLKRLVTMAATIKVVHVYQHIPDSEKYTARAFLIRLGYNGKDQRGARKVLLDHLEGYAAFRHEADMDKHKAKLLKQRREKAAQQRGRRRRM